jgi:GH15 family glucan-1,4-alpha-glucosidase
MRHALLGNCAFQALVSDRGSVDWLCFPRFDSSPVFGALLDEEQGGVFSIQPAASEWTSSQAYLANTNIVVTTFHEARGSFDVTDFAPRFHQYERYYRPTMLVRRVRRLSGEPVVRIRCEPTYDYGRIRPEVRMASNHLNYRIGDESLRLTTDVPLTYVVEKRSFLLEGEYWLVLTWGDPLEAPLVETARSFLLRTQDYWERWVKHTAVPGRFQREVVRSALVLKLHQYEDTGAVIASATTSLPEWPGSGRNWDYRYCWLRDAYFTLRAMRRINHFDELEAFVGFIKNVASRSDVLQPVYSISGETRLDEEVLTHLAGYCGSGPVRRGNDAYRQVQYDAYGEAIAVLAPFFLDFRFSDRLTENSLKVLERLLARIDQVMDWPDAGIWEIRDDNRVHTFSLLFHWVGGMVSARIGETLRDDGLRRTGMAIAERARAAIESAWVPDRGFYADSLSSQNEDAAMLTLINLGYLTADSPRAHSHLAALERRLQVGDHLMHRYLHHDGISADHGATFTVCGFWYVEALARLGQMDKAERAMEKLLAHANHVGLLSEDLHPLDGTQLGNFPQTYSHVGVINAAFAIAPLSPEMEELDRRIRHGRTDPQGTDG